ncbi:MAG: dephospho-CoA kinase [Nitrospirota bacterium]
MKKIGLTGGIASGKSTISHVLMEMGARIIDADALAREALAQGTAAYSETVRLFGKRILSSSGHIDRKALGDIVFKDPEKRAALEGIVHPEVFRREAEITEGISRNEPGAVIVFDAALLIESGAYRRMDGVIVVWCSRQTQMDRLVKNCHLSPGEARLRIESQMPLDEKKRYASWVIDNDGELQAAISQARGIYPQLAQ